MTRVRLAAMAVLLSVAAPVARAQSAGGRCNIELRAASDSTRMTSTSTSSDGPRNVFVGGRMEARCLNQDVRLLADSAEWYQQAQVLYLIGNVRYTEPRVRVSSDNMSYFQVDERLLATGRVEATLPSGSVMRGDTATYFRAVKLVRPQSRLVAQNRPRLWLAQRDSAGKSGEPVQITANQITTENDSLVYAGGKVEITRSDLDARSDSAYLDGGNELARLMVQPVIIGKGERGYTLRGRQVELYTRNRVVQRVLAQADARATSDDLLLTADTIDLRVDNNRAQAAFVWGKSRARAISPDRDLIADSLAVRMPDQQLREVRAFRNAVVTTIPDTATIRTGVKDWLKGDTIYAYFDSTARVDRVVAGAGAPAAPRARPAARDSAKAGTGTTRRAQPPRQSGGDTVQVSSAATADTARKPRLKELQAIGHASARYQVTTQGSTPQRPGLNYSRGDRITVTMDSTGVSRVQIDEHAVGLYLEPTPESMSSRPSVSEATPSSNATPATVPVRPRSTTPSVPSATPTVIPPRPATRRP